MFDRHIQTIAAEPARTAHYAISSGIDRRAGRGGKIDTIMRTATTQNRVCTHAVIAGQAGVTKWHPRRDRDGRGRGRGGIGTAIQRFPIGEELRKLLITAGHAGILRIANRCRNFCGGCGAVGKSGRSRDCQHACYCKCEGCETALETFYDHIVSFYSRSRPEDLCLVSQRCCIDTRICEFAEQNCVPRFAEGVTS